MEFKGYDLYAVHIDRYYFSPASGRTWHDISWGIEYISCVEDMLSKYDLNEHTMEELHDKIIIKNGCCTYTIIPLSKMKNDIMKKIIIDELGEAAFKIECAKQNTTPSRITKSEMIWIIDELYDAFFSQDLYTV